MSWEKEEAKSRHVDFQCVKSKSITNLAELIEARVDQAAAQGGAGAPAAAAAALIPAHGGDEPPQQPLPIENLRNEPYPIEQPLPEQFDNE